MQPSSVAKISGRGNIATAVTPSSPSPSAAPDRRVRMLLSGQPNALA